MPRRKPRTVAYRRKREGKTNYSRRLKTLLGKCPRLVVRITAQKVIAQIIEFKTTGDVVLVGVDSSELKKQGWTFSLKNMPAAYLTGYLLGKKALENGIEKAILDMGFRSPIKGNKVYACLKGVLDSGLDVVHSPEVFPSEDRIAGKHIQDYAAKSKEKFSKLLKNKADPTKISELFEQIKQKIGKQND